MILAIGNSGNYEVSAYKKVVEELKLRGHDAVLFKQDKCLEGEYLSFEVDNDTCMVYITIDGKKYSVDDFSGVWYMKPHLPRELMEFRPVEYRQFIHRQFYVLRETLYVIFGNKKWLNDPLVMRKVENKPYQLKVARDLGFKVPDTLITSNPTDVKKFYDKNKNGIVVKMLSTVPILGEVIYTNIVTSKYMSQIDTVRKSPAIFQSLVAKKYELRITVVGDKIFPAKISSQDDEYTSIDWRRKPKLNDYDIKIEETRIPEALEDKIFAYMKILGLQYGCIDFVVTPENEFVFLEINPNGQWYFIQLRTESKIASAIADLLT